MSPPQQRLPKKLLEFTILASCSLGTVDQVDILSDHNKKRCIAQLEALENTVGSAKKCSRAEFKRQAAVLIPLCLVDCQPSIVFTLRSQKLRSHAGQVRYYPDDDSIKQIKQANSK